MFLPEQVVVAVGPDVPEPQLLDLLLGVHRFEAAIAIRDHGVFYGNLVNVAVSELRPVLAWEIFRAVDSGVCAEQIEQDVLHATWRSVEVDAEVHAHLELAVPDRLDVLEGMPWIEARLGHEEPVIRRPDQSLVVEEAYELHPRRCGAFGIVQHVDFLRRVLRVYELVGIVEPKRPSIYVLLEDVVVDPDVVQADVCGLDAGVVPQHAQAVFV